MLTTLVDHQDNILQVAISKDNSLVVSASYSNLKIWDHREKKILRIIPVFKEGFNIYSFVLTPDSKFIIAGLQGSPQEGGILATWRITDGELIHAEPFHQGFGGYDQKLNNLAISRDHVFITLTAQDRMVKVWMNFLTYMELNEGFMKRKDLQKS